MVSPQTLKTRKSRVGQARRHLLDLSEKRCERYSQCCGANLKNLYTLKNGDPFEVGFGKLDHHEMRGERVSTMCFPRGPPSAYSLLHSIVLTQYLQHAVRSTVAGFSWSKKRKKNIVCGKA